MSNKLKQTLLLITVAGLLFLGAEVSYGQKNYSLNKALVLQMPEGSGSNGAGVAYLPGSKIYLACMAGNKSFPMAAFNSNGEFLDQYEAGFDARGFWYNEKAGEFQGNAYNQKGIIGIKTDASGKPLSYHEVNDMIVPPDAHSCGAFNPRKKEVLFLDDNGAVLRYNLATGKKEGSVQLSGLSGSGMDNINSTVIIYTGRKKQEIGVLDKETWEVKLYNLKNGKLSARCKIPEDISLATSFNFAYANGLFWIFDKDERAWQGLSL